MHFITLVIDNGTVSGNCVVLNHYLKRCCLRYTTQYVLSGYSEMNDESLPDERNMVDNLIILIWYS